MAGKGPLTDKRGDLEKRNKAGPEHSWAQLSLAGAQWPGRSALPRAGVPRKGGGDLMNRGDFWVNLYPKLLNETPQAE